MPQNDPYSQEPVYVEGVGPVPYADAVRMPTSTGGPFEQYPQIAEAPQEGTSFAPVREGLGRQLRQGLPMVAGLANLHPALRSAKAAFAIPSVVEGLRQVLEGESIDPVRAGMEGTMGSTALGLGKILKIPAGFGRQQVRNVLQTTPQTDYLTKTAIREGADLSPQGVSALKDRLKALRAQGKLGQADAVEDLIANLEAQSLAGGGELPLVGAILRSPTTIRASGGGGGMLSPRTTLNFGRALAGPVGQAAPPTIEGLLRIVLGILHAGSQPVPLQEPDQ